MCSEACRFFEVVRHGQGSWVFLTSHCGTSRNDDFLSEVLGSERQYNYCIFLDALEFFFFFSFSEILESHLGL